MRLKSIFFGSLLVSCSTACHAQLIHVYPSGGCPPISFDMNEVDSLRFSPEPASEEISSFAYTGSYAAPTSKVWGNTGLIPIVYGQRITYTSEGLNDYCCVFFNAAKAAIAFGKRAAGLSAANPYATVITETLTAPKDAAFVCVYGKTNKSHSSYIPYTLSVKIDRLVNEEEKEEQGVQHQYINAFSYVGGYSSPTSKGWGNTGLIPIEGGSCVSYVSGGLNDYCCVIFDKNKRPIAFGTKTPGTSEGNGMSTVLSETIVAPPHAAYVCVYGNNSSQRTYVDYQLFVDIFKDDNYLQQQQQQHAYLNSLAQQIGQRQGTLSYEPRKEANEAVAQLLKSYPAGKLAGNHYYDIPAALSVTDDDTIDPWLNPSQKGNGRNGGFYSALYPVMASLDAPATEACVGSFIGLDKDSPNALAHAAKGLAAHAGWELANHTMDHRYRFAYLVQTLADVSSLPVTPQPLAYTSNSCTYVHVEADNKCYYYDKNRQWSVVPHGYEPVYLMDFAGNHLADNPCYDNEYEVWTNQQKMEEHLGYRPVTFIQPGHRSSRKRVEYVKASHKYMLSNAGATSANYLTVPLSMSIKRISVNVAEGSSNLAGEEFFEELKTLFQEILENGHSGIMMLHMYSSGWSNEVKSQLVSNGGTYPDSWVHPCRQPVGSNGSGWLQPAPETGLSSWADWHPCPGTRLYQLWRFLKYAKEEKGVLLLTVRDNLDRMANKTEGGYFVTSKQSNFDDINQDYFVEDCFGNIILHRK